MADMTVNIARALLHDKVCPNRPPSGKSERERIIHDYARQLTSTTAKNIRQNSAKKNKCSPTASNMKLFIKVDHPQNNLSLFGKSSCSANAVNHTSNNSTCRHQRRAQSAKARLEPRKTSASKKRPVLSAKVTWGPNQIESAPMSDSTKVRNKYPESRSESLQPNVSGYKTRDRSWQSEPDLSKLGRPLKSCLKSASKNSLAVVEVLDDLTDEALGVIADDEESEREDSDTEDSPLPLPKTLRPLAHYWTPDIPPQYIGIDHLRCWVFLPSMAKDYQDLPVVPSKVKDPTEELPYKDKIVPALQWNKRPVDDWTCHHHHRATPTVPPLQIYDPEGRLMHETAKQSRTVGIVRREIEELELLMKGIGTAGGCSLVVQYQYEISKLQKMVDNTLGRVEEIEKRERERLEALEAQQKDYCGLRKFYKEHDEVIRQIRLQHSKCVRELAILERDLKIDSARAHFRKEEKLNK